MAHPGDTLECESDLREIAETDVAMQGVEKGWKSDGTNWFCARCAKNNGL
jgi:hypothetical protein